MKAWGKVLIILALSFTLPAIAAAAGLPNAGTTQHEIEKQFQEQQPQPGAPAPTPLSPPPAAPEGVKVLVKDFRITGEKIFTENQLKSLLAGFIGKELTINELERAAQTIEEFYRSKGFIVRVYLPQQEIKEGVVQITVIEGKLEGVDVDEKNKHRLSSELAKNYIIAAQPLGETMLINSLERGMLLLNDLPGVSATSILHPGQEAGASRLLLKVEDTPLFTGGTFFNNAGQRATGTSQGIVFASANNITGIGDQFTINSLHSDKDGTDFSSAAYSLPIGGSGLRLGSSVSGLKYKLVGAFSAFDANGSAETYEGNASYPFIRSRNLNLTGSITYDYKCYLNKVIGSTTSDKRVNVGSFALKGDYFDQFQGGGHNIYGVTLYTGSLQLGNAPDDKAADEATARTEGQYLKLGWNASRLQTIYARTSLYLGFSGQYADKNLDSSEKFILGGPYGVRAYPVNEASGDDGVLANVELRQNLINEVQAIGFLDYGHIVVNHTPWAGSQGASNTPNRYDLAGAGPGINLLLYRLKMNASLNVAWPIGRNPGRDAFGNDNDGTHKRPRLWVSAQKYF